MRLNTSCVKLFIIAPSGGNRLDLLLNAAINNHIQLTPPAFAPRGV